jgi:hypothetical protein
LREDHTEAHDDASCDPNLYVLTPSRFSDNELQVPHHWPRQGVRECDCAKENSNDSQSRKTPKLRIESPNAETEVVGEKPYE